MKGLKIEDNVSVPATWPIGELEVGQSFVAPPERSHAARSYASAYGKRYPHLKFATRKTKDGGMRVWRIK